jgi:mitofusin 2
MVFFIIYKLYVTVKKIKFFLLGLIDNSPLKLFSRAKNSINTIYKEFFDFLKEVYQFLDSTDLSKSNLISDKDREQMKTYQEKCDRLIKMISRDRMKVVFFGRTSNGKSTAINAMLGEKILPTGIGHTTNCFLQVEGSDSTEEACIYTPDSETSQSVNVNIFLIFIVFKI